MCDGQGYQTALGALHSALSGNTGRSAARLARLLREQEVRGSNPRAPIAYSKHPARRVPGGVLLGEHVRREDESA